MDFIRNGNKVWFNQIKTVLNGMPDLISLLFIDIEFLFRSTDSVTARSESSSVYPKFTIQNNIWRNVRYIRQIRCHSTDTSVSIIIHWMTFFPSLSFKQKFIYLFQTFQWQYTWNPRHSICRLWRYFWCKECLRSFVRFQCLQSIFGCFVLSIEQGIQEAWCW